MIILKPVVSFLETLVHDPLQCFLLVIRNLSSLVIFGNVTDTVSRSLPSKEVVLPAKADFLVHPPGFEKRWDTSSVCGISTFAAVTLIPSYIRPQLFKRWITLSTG